MSDAKALDEMAVLMDVAAAGKRMALHAANARPGPWVTQVETTASYGPDGAPCWVFSLHRNGCLGIGRGASIAEAERATVTAFDANNGVAEVMSWQQIIAEYGYDA